MDENFLSRDLITRSPISLWRTCVGYSLYLKKRKWEWEDNDEGTFKLEKTKHWNRIVKSESYDRDYLQRWQMGDKQRMKSASQLQQPVKHDPRVSGKTIRIKMHSKMKDSWKKKLVRCRKKLLRYSMAQERPKVFMGWH